MPRVLCLYNESHALIDEDECIQEPSGCDFEVRIKMKTVDGGGDAIGYGEWQVWEESGYGWSMTDSGSDTDFHWFLTLDWTRSIDCNKQIRVDCYAGDSAATKLLIARRYFKCVNCEAAT